MKHLLTTLLILIPIFTYEITTKTRHTVNETKKDIDYYQLVKTFIKSHENKDFDSLPHNDGRNNKTLGYGWKLTKKDKHLKRLKFITEKQADSLLDYRLQKSLSYVDRNYKGLSQNKSFAIAHLEYCIGSGQIKKSKIIVNNQLDSSQLFKHCKINNRFNINRYKNRLFEYKLFYRL